VNRKGATDVQDDIWKKVQELGIPAKKDDIQVTADQGLVQITVNYSVPVDLIVYQYSLQFHPQVDNKAI
jgi:PleD family two-component response regulator